MRACIIIGAGAHVEFGMPTGRQIVEYGEKWANGVGQAYGDPGVELLKDAMFQFVNYDGQSGSPQERAKNLFRLLAASPHDSIDALLARWPDQVDFGKQVLAAYLTHCQSRALGRVRLGGIYKKFVDAIIERPALVDVVDMVTFNYDLIGEVQVEYGIKNYAKDISGRFKRPSF
jgi:hypothetical protein